MRAQEWERIRSIRGGFEEGQGRRKEESEAHPAMRTESQCCADTGTRFKFIQPATTGPNEHGQKTKMRTNSVDSRRIRRRVGALERGERGASFNVRTVAMRRIHGDEIPTRNHGTDQVRGREGAMRTNLVDSRRIRRKVGTLEGGERGASSEVRGGRAGGGRAVGLRGRVARRAA